MLPLRFVRAWRTTSIALLVLVLAAALMPAVWLWPNRWDYVARFDEIDKWLHGATFAFLAIWFAGQYRARSYWRIAFGLLCFGSLIEVVQRFVSYRSADWFDLAADAAGISAGLLVALAGLGGWSLQVENRFAGPAGGPGRD